MTVEQMIWTFFIFLLALWASEALKGWWAPIADEWRNRNPKKPIQKGDAVQFEGGDHIMRDIDFDSLPEMTKHWIEGGGLEIGHRSNVPAAGYEKIGYCKCGCGLPIYWRGYGRMPKYWNVKHKNYYHKQRSDPFT